MCILPLNLPTTNFFGYEMVQLLFFELRFILYNNFYFISQLNKFVLQDRKN